MVTYLLKKSYRLKDLKEVNFNDLWGDNGLFTTMWIFGKPAKILFFKKHIKNLLNSLKVYKLNRFNLDKNILKLLKLNIKNNKKYNHLLRVAINNQIISISLRKRLTPKLKFNLRLVNYKRIKPQFKNLKYKRILKYLSKIDNSSNDIALCVNKMLLESGTSNLLFVKNKKIYSPINKFYKGINYKFFENTLGKFIKKDIFIDDLNNYDEIILVGSGKGVVSVETIKDHKWKRKSLSKYKVLSKLYKAEILRCSIYK